MTRKSTAQGVDPLLEAALHGELSQPQARQLAQLAPEAVTLALLALARRIAELRPRDCCRAAFHAVAGYYQRLSPRVRSPTACWRAGA